MRRMAFEVGYKGDNYEARAESDDGGWLIGDRADFSGAGGGGSGNILANGWVYGAQHIYEDAHDGDEADNWLWWPT